MIDKLHFDQLLLSSLNSRDDLQIDSFEYQSVFLNSIKADPTNGRFLPTIFVEDEHARQFVSRKLSKKQLASLYDAENFVLIGKSCIVNCFKYGSEDWKRANQTIESIIDLADNISVSEMIQTPTIYPIDNNQYQILTGHRRFFALVYVKGYGSTAQFKLYAKRPLLTKVKQFQENASREDLPQYGKLQAFLNARSEIDALNHARQRTGLKKLTVKEIAANLGISMGAFDNYNVLTRYLSVQTAYESGLALPFIRVKKIVLATETAYKETHNKSVLNVTDKKNISEQIGSQLTADDAAKPIVRSYKIKPLKSPFAIQTLLKSNIMELNTGIDWHSLDWQDHVSVSNALNELGEFLNSQEELIP